MLSYQIQGEGKTVVLLHGFCESKHVWQNIVAGFSKFFKVITIDLPGFGESELCLDTPSMENFAIRVQEVLIHLQVESSILIGHSMGGYVALALAELFPTSIQGLIMFHSSATADDAEKKEKRNKSIEFVKNQGSEAFVRMLLPTLFKEDNKTVFSSELTQLIDQGTTISPQAIIDGLTAMRDRKDRTVILKNLNFPVLYIIGKFDDAIPLETSLEQCHLAKDSQANFLSESGHMGMIEEPAKSINIILNFLMVVYQS